MNNEGCTWLSRLVIDLHSGTLVELIGMVLAHDELEVEIEVRASPFH
jgi:hypothetical protein